MSLGNQIQRLAARSQQALEDAYPSTITIAGMEYRVTSGGIRRTKENAEGGPRIRVEVKLALAVSRYPDRPAIRSFFRMDGVDFQIVDCPDRPSQGAWHITGVRYLGAET